MVGKKRTTKKTTEDYGGLDPEILRTIASRIPPNAVTGKVELGDIMQYMSEHPDEMDALVQTTSELELGDKNGKIDLENYDYASLAKTIRHESFWVLQLEHMGAVDRTGRAIPDEKIHSTPGARQIFMLYLYDDRERFRVTQEFLRRAIAKPLPPLKPELPWFLMLSLKFKQHEKNLKPFLDSLPKPFHWRLETQEEQNTVKEGVYKVNEDGAQKALVAADKFKATGNRAFVRKDRAGALKAYKSAIDALVDVLSMTPDYDDEIKAKKQLAFCYGNRAAAHMMPGDGIDLKRAVEDGKAAEHYDEHYAKAYIRQASAYQQLGDLDAAKDAIVRGLRLPELENNQDLVDRLVELYTDGKGLSDDEDVFKNWLLDIKMNDQKSSERLKGLEGAWRERLDTQFAKWRKT